MLELFFKNNQAPAINSDNLNRIISEINEVEATGIQNKARTMDLQSEIARLVIEKGGSIVQANPEEEGSENITSILIDDKVYKISIEGIGDLERRIETVETDKADELTMNTGIDISDWDRDIDPDVPVIVDKYTNYHDAVSKISQQIDVMGNRTDDLKTSLNEVGKRKALEGASKILTNTEQNIKVIDMSLYNTLIFTLRDSGATTCRVCIYIPSAQFLSGFYNLVHPFSYAGNIYNLVIKKVSNDTISAKVDTMSGSGNIPTNQELVVGGF